MLSLQKTIFFALIFSIGFINLFCAEDQLTDLKTSADLGNRLFFDKILSSDKSISCASCHKPEFAYADTVALSMGVNGKRAGRNTPTAMNMANRNAFFWDGRAATLEEQALGPIENPNEMNLPISEAIIRLNKSEFYLSAFQKIFNSKPTKELLSLSISDFERTLETADSRFDRYMQGDDKTLLNASEQRGHDIFLEKGKCFDCHFSPDFTTDEYHSIGLYNGKDLNDEGRSKISKDPKDIGKFKVPGLRNIAITAPYMHNGQFKTLEEVVDYYNAPDAFVKNSINKDSLLMKPLNLTEAEKKDLVAYLKTLTDYAFLKK